MYSHSSARIIFISAWALLALGLSVWLTDSNQSLFLWLNEKAQYLPQFFWSNLTFSADTLFAVSLFLLVGSFKPELLSRGFILVIVGGLFVHLAKAGFDASRPAAVLALDEFTIIGPTLIHHSFPSGHSFTALASAGLLMLSSRHLGLSIALLVWGLLGALSRVAVGAHWPLDVTVGAGTGLLFVLLVILIEYQLPKLSSSHAFKTIAAILYTITTVYLIFHDSGYPYTYWLNILLGLSAIGISVWKLWWPVGVAIRRELRR